MASILAVEASTEHCSIALSTASGEVRELSEHAPRRHNRLLFEMLDELLPDGELAAQGIECLAYGSGPGSFTGLRVAASLVQGLAFTGRLPVAAVSTLAALAQAALEEGAANGQTRVFCALDAKVGEIYCTICEFAGGIAYPVLEPWVCKPGDLQIPGVGELLGVGDGLFLVPDFPALVRGRLTRQYPELYPRARCLLPAAETSLRSGDLQRAGEVHPVYVRDEISWKKLSEQGRGR